MEEVIVPHKLETIVEEEQSKKNRTIWIKNRNFV